MIGTWKGGSLMGVGAGFDQMLRQRSPHDPVEPPAAGVDAERQGETLDKLGGAQMA